MKRLAFLISAVLACTGLASASPKIAVVSVKEIYQKLPSTAVSKKEIEQEQQAILRDARLVAFRELLEELDVIKNDIRTHSASRSDDTTRILAAKYDAKRREATAMQVVIEQFRAKRTKEINQKMVAAMRSSLNRITETSHRIAKEKGFEIVFDRSGETSTGLPTLLYTKNPSDISDAVFDALMDSEPPPPDEAPPEEAAPNTQ